MTVCVAAISKTIDGVGHFVIGAADRMLTAGDIEFEPERPKIALVTPSVGLMLAGDMTLQNEIYNEVFAVVQHRIKEDPNNWWLVKDVANIYLERYQEAALRRLEISLLSPLGLDRNSFIARQHEMLPGLVERLSKQLQQWPKSEVEAIVFGIDPLGAHVYVVAHGDVRCHDVIGFAAIGGGAWHATSQFMFSKHTFEKGFPETLLLTYSAKRRAEIAPGVGTGTDMVIIGPNLGANTKVGDHVINKLASVYSETQDEVWKLNRNAEAAMSKFIEEVTKAAAQSKDDQAAPSLRDTNPNPQPPAE